MEKKSHQDKKTEFKYISGDYDTLVLSGGGIHSIVMMGALQFAEDNFLLGKIKNFIGTSAGAICCYLLAIGYTPQDILVYLCTNQVLERIRNFNLVAMLNGNGAVSYNYIHEILEKMTIEKIGKLITLEDLRNDYKKTLICTSHNTTRDKLEILSYETYPKMPCLIALRMTSNLPFIFDRFKYMGNYYVDGGVSNNFPLYIGDKIGKKVLGILLESNQVNFSSEKTNVIEYMYYLMFISHKLSIKAQIKNASKKCRTINITPGDIAFFNFNLDTPSKLELFSSGYKQMKKKLFLS
jgi:predicted acylesterase/phospholipase RssA